MQSKHPYTLKKKWRRNSLKTSSTIREREIKSTLRSCLTPVRKVKTQKTTDNTSDKELREVPSIIPEEYGCLDKT